jgi:hypothetical protein
MLDIGCGGGFLAEAFAVLARSTTRRADHRVQRGWRGCEHGRMSPFPVQFTDRWDNQSRLSYHDAVCWHVLLGGDAAVQATAATARQRLARFTGLHMTPPEWLHVTILRVGTADTVTRDDMTRMLARAQADLTRTAPVTVTLQRVVYHPEAIALSVSPGSALAPVFAAARTATREVLGADAGNDERASRAAPGRPASLSSPPRDAAPWQGKACWRPGSARPTHSTPSNLTSPSPWPMRVSCSSA